MTTFDAPTASYDARLDWTAEQPAPRTDPLLSLSAYGPSSFVASDLDRFARWIAHFGFVRMPGRSSHEYARFARHRQLIVAYHSRTLLIQGAYADATHRLLAELAGGAE